MAVAATIYYFDGWFALSLYPGVGREWIASDLGDLRWPFDLYWDVKKLDHGEYDFGGIAVIDVSDITDYWLSELDKLDLPRVDVPEAGVHDATISDVLHWARQTYPSRYKRAIA